MTCVPPTGYKELAKVGKPVTDPYLGRPVEEHPEMNYGLLNPTSDEEEATATDHGDDGEGSNASSSTEEVPLQRAPSKAKSVVVPEIFKRAKKNSKKAADATPSSLSKSSVKPSEAASPGVVEEEGAQSESSAAAAASSKNAGTAADLAATVSLACDILLTIHRKVALMFICRPSK